MGDFIPHSFNQDREWLRKRAAAEDGSIVSVGGLVSEIERIADAQRYQKLKLWLLDQGSAEVDIGDLLDDIGFDACVDRLR